MTDPHNRPYTFGWHDELIRRETGQAAATGDTFGDYADAAERLSEAKAEALEEAAGKVMGHGDGGPVRLVTVRRWLLDRATAYREGDL